jgi:hypothetical protein
MSIPSEIFSSTSGRSLIKNLTIITKIQIKNNNQNITFAHTTLQQIIK